jgi:hypothetical protein
MEGDRMENEEQEEERRESPKGKRAWQKAELEYVERRQAGESIQALSDSLYVAESLCLEWEQAHKKEIEQSRFLQTGNLLREKGLTR